MLRKLKWHIPGEPLAALCNWCQGPVPCRGPAVEKHCSTLSRLFILLGFSRTRQLPLSSERRQFHSVHPPFVNVILFQVFLLSKRKTRRKKKLYETCQFWRCQFRTERRFKVRSMSVCGCSRTAKELQRRDLLLDFGRIVDGSMERKFLSEIEGPLACYTLANDYFFCIGIFKAFTFSCCL